MSNLFVSKRYANNYSDRHRQSSVIPEYDRPTPMPYENSYNSESNIDSNTRDHYEPRNNNSPFRSSSRLTISPEPLSKRIPVMYYVKTDETNDEISDRQSSPGLFATNQISPIPFQNSFEKKTEMYHLTTVNDDTGQSPYNDNMYRITKFADDLIEQDKKKVTVYLLTTTSQVDSTSSPVRRTPSFPVS